MQGRKGNSNASADSFKLESLKKIMPNDRFPCFSCFDHPKDKLECKQCQGNGWISGAHPMVQFAEDFIEKRMGGMVHSQMISSMDMGDSMVRMSLSDDPYKKQRDSFPGTLNKTGTFGHEQAQQQEEEQLQQLYFCDECVSKDPMKGKRYHCKECEDFDLCENCFVCGMHSQHAMQQILPFKRPANETLLAKNSQVNLIRKSVKFSGK